MPKLPRVTKKNPCRICGKGDYCGFTDDGGLAICMRVSSPKQAKNGGYIHVLDESVFRSSPKRISPAKKIESALGIVRTAEAKSAVYLKFLEFLILSYEHKAALFSRGLDETAVFLGGYKSMPSPLFAQNICRQLIKEGCDLRGIPGFYSDARGNFHFVDYGKAEGFIIPIKDEFNRIRALQLRRDDDRQPKYLLLSSADRRHGASSGAPFHVVRFYPMPTGGFDSVIITEGILKANVIGELAQSAVVGLVGAGTFGESFVPQLKKVFPNLKQCKIAFDMDWQTNEMVSNQRARLTGLLTDGGIKVSFLTWNQKHKGLDDHLLAASRRAT